jgi:hypothetical protein
MSNGRMATCPFTRVPDTCQGALKLFWLVVAQSSIKTHYVGDSFILEVTGISTMSGNTSEQISKIKIT